MRRTGHFRHLPLVLGLALVAYGVCFGFIQHRRTSKGPWAVTFTSQAGSPTLIVNQARLGIADVRVVFSGQVSPTNTAATIQLAQARAVPFELPFGHCVFLDPLFLPGTVVLEAFGHRIQLLPRALTIDGIERPWLSGETIQLPPNDSASTPPP